MLLGNNTGDNPLEKKKKEKKKRKKEKLRTQASRFLRNTNIAIVHFEVRQVMLIEVVLIWTSAPHNKLAKPILSALPF